MSLAVLLVSLLFAGIQIVLSWMLLAFEPISQILDKVTSIVTTGAVFGFGMILTFVIIFIVGLSQMAPYAAQFVRTHPGRTLGLGCVSVVLVLIVSMLGEMLYQADPLPSRVKPTEADICFALDFSWSMNDSAESLETYDPFHINITAVNKPANGKSYAAGETVNYRIEVLNISGQELTGITVTAQKNNDTWQIPRLGKDESQTFSTSYTLTAADARDDFYFVVSANCDINQASGRLRRDHADYELAFLHRAEGDGMTQTLYQIVDSMVHRIDNLKKAFGTTLDQMSDGQRVCVIIYRNEAKLVVDWCELNKDNRAKIKRLVEAEDAEYQTSFANALTMADQQVKKALSANRRAAVIMLSDGEDDSFRTVSAVAPVIIDNAVHVHTLLISDQEKAPSLVRIASETGGQFTATTSDLNDITHSLVEAVDTIQAEQSDVKYHVPDTLITERYVTRKTIIDARVLRIGLLFILGSLFKLISAICIGNNKTKFGPHLIKAMIIGLLAAFWVEFGYVYGLPLILVIGVFWILLMAQVVTPER